MDLKKKQVRKRQSNVPEWDSFSEFCVIYSFKYRTFILAYFALHALGISLKIYKLLKLILP